MLLHNIILLATFATLPSISVDPGENPLLRQPIRNPIDRYIELHRLIYDNDPSRSISLEQMKASLEEMSAFERSGLFRTSIQYELKGFPVNRFKHVVNKYNNSKPVTNRFATITDLFLQTFNYDSNDCTTEYFDQLEFIHDSFERNPIVQALEHNRELQYENCWIRLMKSLVATSKIVGLDIRSPLDELLALVYPDQSEIIIPSAASLTTGYEEESSRISQKISQLLMKYRNNNEPNINLRKECKITIERSCKLLMEKTKFIMTDIYKLIKFTGHKRNFMTKEHAQLMNRYVLCRRIIADSNYIYSNLFKYDTEDQAGRILNTLDDMPVEENSELITQYLADYRRNLAPGQATQQQQQQQTIQDLDDDSERPTKRARIGDLPLNEGQLSFAPGLGESKRVLKVLQCIGKGDKALYKTLWTDGSISYEKKEYLVIHWYAEWDYYYHERKSRNQLKYYVPKSGRSSTNLQDDQIESTALQSDEPFVIRIERSVGRGKKALYPTIWSNGEQTMETRVTLETRWPEKWLELVRRLGVARQKLYLARKKGY